MTTGKIPNMDRKQKLIFIIYLVLFLFLTVVFVPFTARVDKAYADYYASIFAPRQPILAGSYAQSMLSLHSYSPATSWCSVRLNVGALLLEIVALSVLFGGVFVLSRRASIQAPPKKAPEEDR